MLSKVGNSRSSNSRKMTVLTLQKQSENELPAGDYFIGELSSFLQDAVLGSWSTEQNYKQGTYTVNADGSAAGGFYIADPACNDGIFIGSNHKHYVVSDANIGIASVELGDIRKGAGFEGTFHHFKEPLKMAMEHGIFKITSGNFSLEIDTTTDWSDVDEGYDSCG